MIAPLECRRTLLASGRLTFARRDEADAAHDDARYPERTKLYEIDGPGAIGVPLGSLFVFRDGDAVVEGWLIGSKQPKHGERRHVFVALPGIAVPPEEGDPFEVYEIETYDAAVARLAEARSLKSGASS